MDPRSNSEDIMVPPGMKSLNIIPYTSLDPSDLDYDPSEVLSIPLHEVGSHITLTARTLQDTHRKRLLDVCQQQLLYNFVEHFIVAGQRVVTEPEQEREWDYRQDAAHFITTMDTIDDQRVAALLARAVRKLDNVVAMVNKLPLWRIVWRKLRHPHTPLMEQNFE